MQDDSSKVIIKNNFNNVSLCYHLSTYLRALEIAFEDILNIALLSPAEDGMRFLWNEFIEEKSGTNNTTDDLVYPQLDWEFRKMNLFPSTSLLQLSTFV